MQFPEPMEEDILGINLMGYRSNFPYTNITMRNLNNKTKKNNFIFFTNNSSNSQHAQ